MNKVILYGSDGDEMKNMMLRGLSPHFAVAYHRNGARARQCGRGLWPLHLADFTCPFVPEREACVFVFKKDVGFLSDFTLPPGSVAILEQTNAPAIRMLSRTGAAAVTCGMSPRDTFSLSSNAFPRVLVSLQRDVRTLDGAVIEPADFPVTLSDEAGEYPLMAVCATLLLLGIPDTAFSRM